jgi:hypothetical protein
MAVEFTMIDHRDLYACTCPTCGERNEVSGDEIDYAKQGDGQLTLKCGHTVSVTDE